MPTLATTVLVVDDEPALVNLAKMALEAGGYEVLTAFNGRQALEVYANQKDRIDLLLTDMNMPRMNGAELACSLVELLPGLPVVFMTGDHTATPKLEILVRHGPFSDCRIIRKPFTPAQLLEEVAHLIAARLSN
jgi:two-component system, cell cycle sensor histidine kinase and response regulator CckA